MRPASKLTLVILLAPALFSTPGWSRPGRPDQLPNGIVDRCASCHVSPGGGGTRTPFGNEVAKRVGPGSPAAFWSPTLAALDSDGDGRTNGQELGDPNGVWTVGSGNPPGPVTNPGNRPPLFETTPPASATIGVGLQYQAVATDPEGNGMRFAKVAGPAWLLVTTNGLVTGTPPEGGPAEVMATIEVQDFGSASRGFSRGATTQSLNLGLISSLAGWQNLRFNLPAEAALADSQADPDQDGMPNLLEYALRTDPKAPTVFSPPPPTFTPDGHLQLTIDLRDDDPKLSAGLEVTDSVPFSLPEGVAGERSDPVPGDGFATWLLTDTALSATKTTRFGRVQVQLAP